METTLQSDAIRVLPKQLGDLGEVLTLAVMLGLDRVAEFVRAEIADAEIEIEIDG